MARIVFMGTPEFAVPCLHMLIDEGYDVAAAVTQPDRPKGRGGKLAPPPMKEAALAAGIRVLQPQRPGDIRAELSELGADLFVTAAYGGILKKRVLELPRLGTVNVHASLLPKYRGSSPIHAALLNGERVTGVTTMLTDAGIDTGDILMSRAIPVADGEYFAELHDRLSVLGAELLRDTLLSLLAGTLTPTPQDGSLATRAPMIEKGAGALDFSLDAAKLVNTVRAFGEWPGAYAQLCGKRIRVHRAYTVENTVLAVQNTAYAVENTAHTVENTVLTAQDAVLTARDAANKDANGAGRGHVPGTVLRVDPEALGVLCGDGGIFNITRLQFESGRRMDIGECWHNLKNLGIAVTAGH